MKTLIAPPYNSSPFINVDDHELFLGKFLKKAGNVLGDLGKGIAKITVAPINAVTGHEYDPKMKTKLGNILEKVGDAAEDVQTGFYGLNTPTETKIGAAIGKVGSQIVSVIPIAGKIHAAATPLLQTVNAKSPNNKASASAAEPWPADVVAEQIKQQQAAQELEATQSTNKKLMFAGIVVVVIVIALMLFR